MTDKDSSFDVIVNNHSGAIMSHGKTDLVRKLENGFGTKLKNLFFTAPENFKTVLECAAIESENHILIAGGDGSAVSAAEVLLQYDRPFGILPLGTMNLFAQDLNIDVQIEKAIAAYAESCRQDMVDIGLVNEQIFLCSAIIGSLTQGSIKRERMRKNQSVRTWSDLIATVTKSIALNEHQDIALEINEERIEITSGTVVVSINSYIANPERPSDRIKRSSLNNGKLGVYIASPKNIAENLRLLFHVLKGNWQDDDSIATCETNELTLWTKEKEIMLTLDGEPVLSQIPMRFKAENKVLPVLVPGTSS